MKRILFVIALFYMLGLSLAFVQTQEDEELMNHPGYVDFEGIGIPEKAEETVEVYVKKALLKLVAQATGHEDSTLSKLLSKLLLIRVNTFSIDSKVAGDIKQRIIRMESALEKKKWEKVLRFKEGDELANVYMKMDHEKIVGLVVMAVEEGDEAVFVNIVGELDLNSIGKLGSKFNIPELDSLKVEDKNKLRRESK